MISVHDNFVCVPVEHKKEFLWCIYENATEQVIRSFYFEDEALDYIKFLKKGGAFAGFTPSFVTIEFDTVKPKANDEFERQFN